MQHNPLILRTKLTPPRLNKNSLHRSRLTKRLLEAENFRLTVVKAGTGFGKSTVLAGLPLNDISYVWYHLTADDEDPFNLLQHLIHGFMAVVPEMSAKTLVRLEEWNRHQASNQFWRSIVDSLINELALLVHEPLYLILDDTHFANHSAESLTILDRLIGLMPSNVPVIAATRYPLELPTMITWRIRGELLEISQAELAFNKDEIKTLFKIQYGLTLSRSQLELLMARTEGWPISLPLIWQRLQHPKQFTLHDVLGQLSGSTSDLFTFLAQEVIEQQPADIQAFLEETAVLRQLTPSLCNQLRHANDSPQILRYLIEKDLFIVDLGEGTYRYHHLFRDLLCNQLSTSRANQLHACAASLYQAQSELEEAIYHYLAGEQFEEAAVILKSLGRQLVRAGRLDTLAGWLSLMPPDVLQTNPSMLVRLGDIARLRSRYDEALGWYQQAEANNRLKGNIPGIGEALRGQARIYLDTVNPAQADKLLQEALRLAEGQDDREMKARLLDLMAENMLNQGRLGETDTYRKQALQLREESEVQSGLPIRLLLRTGQLAEARSRLEMQVEVENKAPIYRPRAHRETSLLLSLILSFLGEQKAAIENAIAGTERGELLASGFVTAVGLMRQGHAWLLHKTQLGNQKAQTLFEKAIKISERLDVPRLRVEAYWGLCQAYGFRHQVAQAEQMAQQGIAIAKEAGDEWIVAQIQLMLGASFYLDGQLDKALHWLNHASHGFQECSDSFGDTVSHLWQCLVWQKQGDVVRLKRDVTHLMQLVKTHGYGFLFEQATLLGPPDPKTAVPLLLFARDETEETAVATQLLTRLKLDKLQTHPGYQLRVQTLGTFRLWRGDQEVMASEWKRQKARQLFQFLITYRDQMMERERIVDMLWPELNHDEGQRDFKIAYTTLCKVLEPNRPRKDAPAYIIRDSSRYQLNPDADLWLDVSLFNERVQDNDNIEALEEALALYQGDFLQEYPFAEWCSEERERLQSLCLSVAEKTAVLQADQQKWESVIQTCSFILSYDNCWEHAYRLLMTAHIEQGNRAQAIRTYHRCVDALKTELGISPTVQTVELFELCR